jgi:septum site-determining protein MinD
MSSSGPYIVKVASYKGGVGKTTLSVNLAVALQLMGAKTLLIDSDTISPSVGFHLGFEGSNIGYSQLLSSRGNIRDVTSVHAPSGLHVITGSIGSKHAVLTAAAEGRIMKMLKKSPYEFVVVDTRPEIDSVGSLKKTDETLVVATPDMPSASAAIKIAASLDRQRLRHSLVLNRVKNKKYEMSLHEVEDLYEGRVGAVIPEDEIVPISIEERIPAYILDRRGPFSSSIHRNAKFYYSGHGLTEDSGGYYGGTGIFARLKRLFLWRRG